MPEFVYIKHPDVQTLGGPVSKEALTEIYAANGWSEATAEEVRQHEHALLFRQERAAALTAEEVETVLTTEDVDAVKKRADLDQLALDRGVDPTLHKDMSSLADAIKSTLTKE